MSGASSANVDVFSSSDILTIGDSLGGGGGGGGSETCPSNARPALLHVKSRRTVLAVPVYRPLRCSELITHGGATSHAPEA